MKVGVGLMIMMALAAAAPAGATALAVTAHPAETRLEIGASPATGALRSGDLSDSVAWGAVLLLFGGLGSLMRRNPGGTDRPRGDR